MEVSHNKEVTYHLEFNTAEARALEKVLDFGQSYIDGLPDRAESAIRSFASSLRSELAAEMGRAGEAY